MRQAADLEKEEGHDANLLDHVADTIARQADLSAEVLKLVKQFEDVFPSEIPRGLPPNRNCAHIEVERRNETLSHHCHSVMSTIETSSIVCSGTL